MRGFDRVAWYCSRLAPVGWGIALLAVLLEILEGGEAHSMGGRSSLPLIALGGASLGILAHTVLGYHVLKSRAFTPEERDALWRHLVMGFGYTQWRQLMRRNRS
jgi:hypothetical protein